MSRLKLLIVSLQISVQVLGQTIDSLHKDLQNTLVSDISAVKKIANNLFKYDPYDEMAIYYLAESFNTANQSDSVSALFNRLKSLDSTNSKPYIFESLFKFERISLQDTNGLAPLKTAYRVNPKDPKTNRLLGTEYYDLFHEAITGSHNPNVYFYAGQSKKHLVQLCSVDRESRLLFKCVIIQLSTYLKDTSYTAALNHLKGDTGSQFSDISPETPYFPINAMISLPSDWEKNFKLDLVRVFRSASFRSEWYSGKLYDMKEPVVYNQKGKTIYRFIWLRSFHKPVVIRLENYANKFQLTWKMAGGAGGYLTGKTVVDKTKDISEAEWQQFQSLLSKASYWQMTPEVEPEGTDGAQWIIEGLENNKYHFVDRWTPDKKTDFQKCALYLLKLTDLQIPKEDMY